MRSSVFLWLMLALILVASCSAQAMDSQEVLRRVKAARNSVGFSGSQVIVGYRGTSLEPVERKVFYGGDGRVRIENAEGSLWPGYILVAADGRVAHYAPELGIAYEGRVSNGGLAGLGLQDFGYDGTPIGHPAKSTYLSREVYVLHLRRADGLHAVLWVDAEFFVVLRAEMRTSRGSVDGIMMFTEVRFMNPSPAAFQLSWPEGTRVYSDRREFMRSLDFHHAAAKLGSMPLAPGPIRDSFRYLGGQLMEADGSLVFHSRYAVGSEMVSVFQKRVETKSGGERRVITRVPSLPPELRGYEWDSDGLRITVLGPRHLRSLDEFVRSFRPFGV